MNRDIPARRRWARAAGLMLAASSLGCQADTAALTNRCCQDIPPGAIPQPVGTFACQWQTQQAERAERDDFVIYEHEWRGDSSELGPWGRTHFERIAPRMVDSPHPIVVQPATGPRMSEGELRRLAGGEPTDEQRRRLEEEHFRKLTEARRQAVVAWLGERKIESPDSRVIVGQPEALGLYGFEAPRVQSGYMTGGQGGGQGGGQNGGGRSGGGRGNNSGGGAGGGVNVFVF